MNKKLFTHHLLSIKSLTRSCIETILERANDFLPKGIENPPLFDLLKGQIVANLFFEPSTRTRHSFEIAAKRLGAIVLNTDTYTSSLQKGESILDTVLNLHSMGTRFFIIRHTESQIFKPLTEALPLSTIINAGDGNHQHPTQGLIDLMTIKQYKSHWNSLCVTIIGDIYHSRVANSLIDALLIMGVSEIRLAGPPEFLPEIQDHRVKKFHELNSSLINSDIIVTLRFQKERHIKQLGLSSIYPAFCLTAEKLRLAKPDAIVMHPGPINHNIEITPEVANGKQSVILKQVRNSVALRMALFDLLSS